MKKYLFTLSILALSSAPHLYAQTLSRLIAVRSSQYGGNPDSSTFQYNNSIYGYDPTTIMFTNFQEGFQNYIGYWNQINSVNLPDKIVIGTMPNYNLIDSTSYQFNSTHNNLNRKSNSDSTIYTYNSIQQQISYTNMHQVSGTWVNENKELYQYHPSGKIKIVEKQKWDTTLSVFLPINLDSMVYPSSVLEEHYFFYWMGNAWGNTSKELYTYNPNHQLTSKLGQSWNGISWDTTSVITYSINSNNQTTAITYIGAIDSFFYSSPTAQYPFEKRVYNLMPSGWELSYKQEFVYTSLNQIKLFKVSLYDVSTSIWTQILEEEYFYEKLENPNIVSTISKFPFQIYPNPTTSCLTINSNAQYPILSIQITNISGQVVFREHNNVKSISVEHLVNGLYFIQVKVGENIYQTKFVKE